MSRPYMPLYVKYFIADTWGLTTEQIGAYFLLVLHSWQNGSLPHAEVDLRRVAGLSKKAWAESRDELARFFDIEDGQWVCRLHEENEIRARKEAARPAISTFVKQQVFLRDGYACTYCANTEGPFELDHVFPWSRGGNHSAENLCVACRPCNRSKRDMTIEEWKQ